MGETIHKFSGFVADPSDEKLIREIADLDAEYGDAEVHIEADGVDLLNVALFLVLLCLSVLLVGVGVAFGGWLAVTPLLVFAGVGALLAAWRWWLVNHPPKLEVGAELCKRGRGGE